jgi:hypothetical protein
VTAVTQRAISFVMGITLLGESVAVTPAEAADEAVETPGNQPFPEPFLTHRPEAGLSQERTM